MRISVKTAAAAACGIAATLLVSGCSVFSDPEVTTKYSYFEPDKTTVTTLPPETTEPTTTEATTADDEAVVAAVEGELASLLDESSVEVVCGGKSVIIQKLLMQVDLKQIKDLQSLIALLKEVEDFAESNGTEDPSGDPDAVPSPA